MMKRWLEQTVNYLWYQRQPLPGLAQLSQLFEHFVKRRQARYHQGQLAVSHLPVPVIIVGNITVGGSGKTPMVIWLSQWLKTQGYQPGIISRGYGGKANHYPYQVTPTTNPEQSGDEPLLIAQRTGCPVWVGPQRVQVAQALLQAHPECSIIISDDGLQHYALARDIEMVMVDGQRGFGNGTCLPAGPLREPLQRLAEVDFIISNGPWLNPPAWPHNLPYYSLNLQAQALYSLTNPQQTHPLSHFKGQTVHAIAGIAHPQRFFKQLQAAGLIFIPHAFGDHASFKATDLIFKDDYPVIMTEKDAVKCQAIAPAKAWVLPVSAELPDTFIKALQAKLAIIQQDAYKND